ncbi:MAG: maleylpyruvate isomerase N-terminal domain-containing protein [Gemmobacter sp.]
MTGLAAAREALRARQGKGARYDAPEAPAADLAQLRLGTACFARKLNELTDAELSLPSAVAGRSRAHVVAALSLHARGICWQIEGSLPDAAGARDPGARRYLADVATAATLPPRALRHLFDHTAIHLNVVLRDLTGEGWSAPAHRVDGNPCTVRDLARERARLIWQGALHLGNGLQARDLPEAFRP